MVDRNAEALAKQLLDLPSPDRARLAGLLIASLEPTEVGVEEAWDDELAARASDLDAGRIRGIPAAAVFAEIDRRLRR
jgi:putative addiction module component (TIGR02574 family)